MRRKFEPDNISDIDRVLPLLKYLDALLATIIDFFYVLSTFSTPSYNDWMYC